ncbi:MAG: hypothetical protein ACYDDA_12380 [Acidiferrobacteraceae bacterium]
MTELEEAAKLYAEAQRRYVAAYDAWRKAHPEERAADDHTALASWQSEVQESCRAANRANRRMQDVATGMFP